MKKPESICIFGDSIAWGAWDMEKGGLVNRLWLDVAKRFKEDYVAIYNLSISGGTSETILKRFESEAKIRDADALIFQTGGNDSSYDRPGNFMVQPEKFRENISEIIKRAKIIIDKIIFMELKNCDESKTMPVSWVPVYYTNESIKKYIKIMEEVCLENEVPFLSIAPLSNEDFEDGLHPNSEGHRKIFEQMKGCLIKNGWI